MKANRDMAIYVSFFALGLIALSLGTWAFIDRLNYKKLALQDQGTVVNNERQYSTTSKGGTWAPVVEWIDDQKKKHRFVSNYSHKPAKYSVGSIVPILYLPDKPETAEVNSFGAMWAQALLPSVIGFVFISLSTLCIAMQKKKRRS